MNGPRKLLPAAVFILVIAGFSSASDIYIAQNAAGANTGADCADAHSAGWFNSSANWGSNAGQIGPGTTVHLCGTFTGAADSTMLTFQGSGASGQPITLLFEPGAVLQAPYWASSVGGTTAGAITLGKSRSWIIVDGGTNGLVQNTANGSSLANHAPSTGISGFGCSNCTVQNLSIANIYVNVSGSGSLGDNSVARAIDFTGSNWTIANNTIHDCGWCVVDFYSGTSDTNENIYGNNVYNFGHAFALAAAATNASLSNYWLHDNHIHDTANWSASGCPFHQDGLHTFGTSGSSMSQIQVYNNLFDGDWGTCPTGFIFVEGGASSTPSHMQSSAWWNNVAIVNPSSPIVNTNGWFDIASGESGTQQVYANTFIGPNNSDNTLCIGMQGLSALSFENNTISNCGDPVGISNSALVALDYNFYGPACGNGNNCFIWNGSFTGSFTAWKSASGGDSHGIYSTTPKLNADGSPQSGSPVIQQGADLSSLAIGSLSSISSDTSKGDIRTPILRPSGTCSSQGNASCWDIGAYQYAASSQLSPPTGLAAVVQ